MVDDKEDDLLKPTTFKEKIEEHTFDVFVGLLVLLVAFEIWDGRRKGIITQNNNASKIEQTAKSVENINNVRTVFFNDTVRSGR